MNSLKYTNITRGAIHSMLTLTTMMTPTTTTMIEPDYIIGFGHWSNQPNTATSLYHAIATYVRTTNIPLKCHIYVTHKNQSM